MKCVDGLIHLDDGTRIPANLTDAGARDEINRRCLGTRLKGGHFAHACFFLGPRKFYETLRKMDVAEREQICMTSISYVNKLYGEEELKRLQRKVARFVNTGLIATLTGAVASDGLEDGRGREQRWSCESQRVGAGATSHLEPFASGPAVLFLVPPPLR